MKTIEQTRRELFDAWYEQYTAKGWSVSKIATWESFNAALDAVAIELPAQVVEFHEGDDQHNITLADCRTAIESTNLGLKIK